MKFSVYVPQVVPINLRYGDRVCWNPKKQDCCHLNQEHRKPCLNSICINKNIAIKLSVAK
jgi:hypothetical protein